MTTAEIIEIGGAQAIKLPAEFRFDGEVVAIRREGMAVIVEPMGTGALRSPPSVWPGDFFESIRIADPSFVRPEQGRAPPAPIFDSTGKR